MYSSVSCALRIHEYIRYYILLSSSYVIMGRTSRRSLMVPGPFSGENTYFYQDLVTLACACVSPRLRCAGKLHMRENWKN